MSDNGVRGSEAQMIACHDCGTLHRVRPLPRRGKAKCSRCGASLYRQKDNSFDRTLMLSLAALFLLILANTYPFMTLKIEGREQVNTLFTGVRELYLAGLWPLAALVFCASILVPLLKVLGTLYVMLPLKLGRRPWQAERVFRWVEVMHPWAMMEIYLLGVLVAYVELSDLGTIELGIAVYSFAALIVIMVASEAALDPEEIWSRLAPLRTPASALRQGTSALVACHSCSQISRLPPRGGQARSVCPRCGAALHKRKTDSLARTWALVITAAVLYVPANVFPVMTVISFGRGAPDTILSGVKHLIEGNMWPLAILVFFASVTVPVLKLIGLTFLLITVQRRSHWRPRDRTLLYRVIEAVGRWSMIDIFMISILVALVNLGSIATIEPGVGATSFAAVVVITMLASMTFDPRLMWDAMESESDRQAGVRV